MSHVYRTPRTAYTRPRPRYQPYTLSWLYDRATQQYITADVSGVLTPYSVFYGATPDVANGDVFVGPLLVSGFPVTLYSDGRFSIDTDGSTVGLSFAVNVYDLSLAVFYGQTTEYVNNSTPQLATIGADVYYFTRGDAAAALDITGFATDAEDVTLTVSISPSSAAPLLTGLTMVDGVISPGGTDVPTLDEINAVTFRWTDVTGAYVERVITLVSTGQDPCPNVVGLLAADASNVLLEANLSVAAITYTGYSGVTPPGYVIRQAPPAGELVSPLTEVSLVISLGPVKLIYRM